MMVSNGNLLFQGVIFRCYVKLREGSWFHPLDVRWTSFFLRSPRSFLPITTMRGSDLGRFFHHGTFECAWVVTIIWKKQNLWRWSYSTYTKHKWEELCCSNWFKKIVQSIDTIIYTIINFQLNNHPFRLVQSCPLWMFFFSESTCWIWW